MTIRAGGTAEGFRWRQTDDWGSGSPSARTCLGYRALGPFDPITVILTYPAETDRLADVRALMAALEVLGNPGPSMAHGDPALEALLPDSINGVALQKESKTGEQLGLTNDTPILRSFGKHPADLAQASATAGQPRPVFVTVTRVRGVFATQLLAAQIKTMQETNRSVSVSQDLVGGRPVTVVRGGVLPLWFYATGELLYSVAPDQEAAATVLPLLR